MKIPVLARLGAMMLKAAGYGTSAQSYSTLSPELIKWFGGPTASGKSVTADSAMALTAMWGCVRILSESIGAIPWQMFRKDPKNPRNAVPADDHQLSTVLNYKPNADMTRVEFKEAMVTNLGQAGNAYCFRDDLGGRPISLYPLRSSLVNQKRKQGGNTKLPLNEGDVFYSVLDRGQWTDYPREKIWHVKGFGNDGLCGLSPIGVEREAFGAALAADEFGARFFGQGGKPSGVMTVPNWLTEDQRDIARENLQQMLGGVTNAHKFALFEGGMKPEPWGEMSLQDMEFLLLRRFNVQEVARIYRIPPHMLADVEKGASYASIEMMSAEFVMYTLMPYFTRFESSVQRWLLGPSEQDYFIRFNYEGLLRADSAARADFYSTALQNGWLSRNEVRALENRNTVDGLDEYTVQTNMTPVDMLQALAAAMAAKPTAAAPSKAGDTTHNTTIALPASMKVDMAAFASEVSGAGKATAALLERVADTQQLLAKAVTQASGSNNDLAAIIAEGQVRLEGLLKNGNDALVQEFFLRQEQFVKELRAVANTKRKLIYNSAGEIVGIEPVTA